MTRLQTSLAEIDGDVALVDRAAAGSVVDLARAVEQINRSLPNREFMRMEDMLRACADWTWETDRDLNLIQISAAVARTLGIPAERLMGRPITHLGRFLPSPIPSADAETAIAQRRPFREASFLMGTASGQEVQIQLDAVPYFDLESSRFAGYRGVARLPLAARRREEEAARTTRELVETLEEALIHNTDLRKRLARSKDAEESKNGLSSEHLAILLHELRTPLNAVIGYADLALDQAQSSQSPELLERRISNYLTNIREAGEHLQKLLSDLRVQEPKAEKEERASAQPAARQPDRQGVNLAAAIRDAKAMTELSARRKGVNLNITRALDAPAVHGEQRALTQILVNLLSNAIKFTPPGGDVGLEIHPRSTLISVVVWDSGPGIPKEEQERIFERSYRLARDCRPGAPSGEGLGLAIARDLTTSMGGNLLVHSQPGEGAEFVLQLIPVK